MKPAVVASACAAALAGGALLWTWRGRASGDPSAPDSGGARTGDAAPPQAELSGAAASSGAEVGAVGEQGSAPAARQSQLPHATLRARVLDLGGAPIEAAEVSWTPLEPAFRARHWRINPWDAIEAATVRTATATDGSFDLEADAASWNAMDSALWVTKPGFAGRHQIFDAGASASTLPGELRLAAAPSARILVLGPEGDAVEGATVTHRGVPDRRRAGSDLDPAEWAHRLFSRTALTDDAGRAEFGALPGYTTVRAVLGELESPGVTVTTDRVIELRLSPCFVVEGQVRRSDGMPVDSDVKVQVEFGSEPLEVLQNWKVSAAIGVDASGRIAATRAPILEGSKCRARLMGGGLIPVALEFDPPAPGQRVWVDLASSPGAAALVHAFGAGGEPLAGAYVEATWYGSEGGPATQTDGSIADEQGQAEIVGLQPGNVWFQASANGHATGNSGPHQVALGARTEIEIRLQPERRIHGRVVHLGEPVPKFEVVLWLRSESQLMPLAIEDPEGRFEFGSLMGGSGVIFASSPDLPRCDPVAVDTWANPDTEVVLELVDGVAGHGLVLDLDTRRPPEDALVQIYTNDSTQLLTSWGEPVDVGADGRFELDGLPEGGVSSLIVSAPGYEPVFAFARASDEIPVDFGVVGMTKGQPLDFQIQGHEPGTGPSYFLSFVGARGVDDLPFGDDGHRVIEGCTPGGYFWNVRGPGGFRTIGFKHLITGQSGLVEIDVRTGNLVRVELVRGADCPAESDVGVTAAAELRRDQGSRRSWTFGAGEPIELRGVGPGPVQIAINVGAVMARQRFEIADVPEQTIRFDMDCARRTLQFFDSAGVPIANAWVVLDCGRPGLTIWEHTDEEGKFLAENQPCDEVIYAISNGVNVFGQRLALDPPGDEPQRVVVDAPHELRVQILDGDVPLPAVALRPIEEVSGLGLVFATTNSNGVSLWSRLRRDSAYVLEMSSNGVWPVPARVSSRPTPDEAQPIQVRRTGVLRLELAGAPPAGSFVELRSLEFGEDVSDWLEAGRVSSSTASMRSGTGGLLVLGGLPRGAYEWRVTREDGDVFRGTADVESGKTTVVEVSLP
jgi:hypothetical protein